MIFVELDYPCTSPTFWFSIGWNFPYTKECWSHTLLQKGIRFRWHPVRSLDKHLCWPYKKNLESSMISKYCAPCDRPKMTRRGLSVFDGTVVRQRIFWFRIVNMQKKASCLSLECHFEEPLYRNVRKYFTSSRSWSRHGEDLHACSFQFLRSDFDRRCINELWKPKLERIKAKTGKSKEMDEHGRRPMSTKQDVSKPLNTNWNRTSEHFFCQNLECPAPVDAQMFVVFSPDSDSYRGSYFQKGGRATNHFGASNIG